MTSAFDTLRTALTGPVLDPDDPGYDAARSVWNAEIDHRPAVIARCVCAADVAAAVTFARRQGLVISVRGGSHHPSGAAVADGGMMIHLGDLNKVSVDPVARRARVGGGALLRDMDVATQAYGLATTSGTVSHTGVGGLTLSGGLGWLGHRHGLALDNLVSAQVVTAEGRVLRTSRRELPELFWALRGGGGNFGVVTEFEFRLHEVGPMVDFGLFFFGLDQGADALRLGRELAATVSRDTTVLFIALNAPPAPFVPERHRFQPGYAVLATSFGATGFDATGFDATGFDATGFDATSFGATDEHSRLAARIRESVPPLFEFVGPLPYLTLQRILDEAHPRGLRCYQDSLYLDELSDAAITTLTERVRAKSSPLTTITMFPLDGAYQDVSDQDAAWGGSRSGYAIMMIGIAPTPELLDAERRWVRSLWRALLPHARGIGGYLNSVTELEEYRVRASYGPATYERLARVKASYDPENVFRHNANITPAQVPG